MTIRWPRIGLTLRGIWQRRILSAMLLVVASVGTAATTMGVTYGEAGGTAALRTTLRDAEPRDQSIVFTTSEWRGPGEANPDRVLRDSARDLLDEANGARFFGRPIVGIEFEDRIDSTTAQGQLLLIARDDVCAHVAIVAGRCPSSPGEVLASTGTVGELGWDLGDEVRLQQFGSVETAEGPTTVPLRVAGTYRVPDRDDPYWIDKGSRYFPTQLGRAFQVEGAPPRYDALITPAGTFGLGDLPLAQMIESAHVTVLVEPAAIVGDEVDEVLAVIAELRSAPAEQSQPGQQQSFAAVLTNLDSVLAEAKVVRDAFAAPALVVTLQVVVLAWVLLFVIVTSVVESRAAELTLARLRGLSAFSVHRFALGEVVTLIVLSVPIGILGGLAAGRLLADRLGPDIPTEVSLLSVLAASAAALGGLVAGGLAARRAVSRTVAEQSQRSRARPARRSWVPDAILLAIAGVGFAELSSGGLLGGGSQHSTLALLAPGLLALAGAILAARLLPFAARIAFRATRTRGGIGGFLAARRIARGTGTATTLIVLATSLGLVTFATAAWSSARTNHREVALSQLGADTVLTVEPSNAQQLTRVVQRIDPDGDEAVAVLARRPPRGAREAALLGVDPQRLAKVAFWRDDFAAQPLATLLASLDAPRPPQVILTGERLRASFRAPAATVGLTYRLVARLEMPGSTSLQSVDLGEIVPGSLVTRKVVTQQCPTGCEIVEHAPGPAVVREARLPDCRSGCELRELTVELTVQVPGSRGRQEATEVLITELAEGRPGDWRVVDAGLGQAGRWRSQLAVPEAVVGATPAGLHLEFLPTSNLRAIAATYPEAIPAITTGGTQPEPFGLLVVGTDGATLPIDVVAHARGLPGLSNIGAVIDYDLADRAAVGTARDTEHQVWCAPGAAERIRADLEAAGVRVAGERRASELAARFGSEGPGLALRLLLAIAAAAALLAAGATAIELYATSRRRAYELAALETVGASRRSLRSGLLLEHFIVLGTAALVGPVTGLIAAQLVVPRVPVFSELPVTPPLRYPLDIPAIAVTGGVTLALAAVAAIMMTIALQHATRIERLREAPA